MAVQKRRGYIVETHQEIAFLLESYSSRRLLYFLSLKIFLAISEMIELTIVANHKFSELYVLGKVSRHHHKSRGKIFGLTRSPFNRCIIAFILFTVLAIVSDSGINCNCCSSCPGFGCKYHVARHGCNLQPCQLSFHRCCSLMTYL